MVAIIVMAASVPQFFFLKTTYIIRHCQKELCGCLCLANYMNSVANDYLSR